MGVAPPGAGLHRECHPLARHVFAIDQRRVRVVEMDEPQLCLRAGGQRARFAHERMGNLRDVPAGEFVILEGLFTLYWEELRGLLDVKVFVEADHEVCLNRRLERDIRERGRSRESVLEQYRTTVEPMARRHILPTAAFADLVLDGTARIEESVAAALERIRGKL